MARQDERDDPGRSPVHRAFRTVLRSLRITRGLSQCEAAALIGVSEQFYGRLERGLSIPRVQTLLQIARELEVSADWLLGDAPSSRLN